MSCFPPPCFPHPHHLNSSARDLIKKLRSHPASDWQSQLTSSGCPWVTIFDPFFAFSFFPCFVCLFWPPYWHFYCPTFHMVFAGIGRPLLPPACPKARSRCGPFPTKARLTPPASKAHTTRLPVPSFSRSSHSSCLKFIHAGLTPNIVLFKIMQSHVWIFSKYFARGNHICIEFKTLCNKKDTSAHATS